jgi:hypothetical protein
MNKLSLATSIFKTMETDASMALFMRDTGGCLVPKLAVSRSVDEAREITFAELAESAIFYFSIAPIAILNSKIFSKVFKNSSKEIAQNIKTLDKQAIDKVRNIKLAKVGRIGASFSILLPLIYAIAPIRNLITLKKTGKEEFIKVVNLKKSNNKPKSKGLNRSEKIKAEEKARQNSIKLLKKLGAITITGLTVTAGFISLAKNPTIFKKAEPFINGLIKKLDFNGNNATLKQFGYLIMPVSVGSYLAASRDKYEVLENIQRFAITIPMMFFGQDAIEKRIYKFFDKKFGSNLTTGNSIKTYKEIFAETTNQTKNLKSKNWSIALAFLINTSLMAAAVGLLNRVATKKRYIRSQKELFANKPFENQVLKWQNGFHQKQYRRQLSQIT